MPTLDELRARFAKPPEPKPDAPKRSIFSNLSADEFIKALRPDAQMEKWQREYLTEWVDSPVARAMRVPEHIRCRSILGPVRVMGIDVASSPDADKTTMVTGLAYKDGTIFIDDVATLDNERKP